VDDSPTSAPRTPRPRRTSWPYVAGAVLAITIQSGWNPADVRALAIVLLALVAVIYAAQG
jgi:hypothetical protein